MSKKDSDAYGHLIYDHYNGIDVIEIIERDDGYIDNSLGPKNYFSEYDKWKDNEKEAMYYVEGKVLDIGCGAGRHSLYLQSRGFDVLAIDNSPLAIKVSKLRGVKKAEVKSLHEIDTEYGKFETILMLGNNFTLVGNPSSASKILKIFHKITSDNGLIIAECADPYSTDNEDHIEYHEKNRKRGRLGGQLTIRVRHRKYISDWFDFLLLSKDEMQEIMKDTGWKIEQFLDGKYFGNYIAIMKKK
ncbi:MAG: methyltransferase domain-containing protein [Candidatus Heimdallarchaeota archaeon]|nr:methyltransferase domain-containing protein [Candidatus Heimdallarchaeota archaeon]MCK4877215.1 methyltransferase domain-containing protein [Candidatus Heimdallarchaeota archaeon]